MAIIRVDPDRVLMSKFRDQVRDYKTFFIPNQVVYEIPTAHNPRLRC